MGQKILVTFNPINSVIYVRQIKDEIEFIEDKKDDELINSEKIQRVIQLG